jgi:DNA polymerase
MSVGALERPPAATTIAALRAEAATCTRCPLYRNATQTVFGEGAAHADIMFVGEQPGDQEDIAGRPFVGPAGKVFDRALAEAGIDRHRTYVTNAVKHFKNEPRGKRRLHRRPNAYEISRCKWWLDAELALVKPKLVVALGATAATALTGRAVAIGRERNVPITLPDGHAALITTHPSAILRMRDDAERHAAMAMLVRDLKHAQATISGR